MLVRPGTTGRIGLGVKRKLGSLGSVPPAAPTVTVLPVISGAAQVGQTLTGSNGTYSPVATSWTRQWNRDGVPISGATGNTRLLTSADLGAVITFTVTPSDSNGPGAAATSLPTSAVIAADAGPPAHDPSVLLETGDVLLLESGDRLLLE